MDEITYNFLLNTPYCGCIPGLLRYRITDLEAATEKQAAGGDIAKLMADALDRPTIELFVFRVEGTFSAPLITGLTPVPISGIFLISLLGPPLATLFSSTDDTRGLGLQFNSIDARHIGGGLIWRPGEVGQQVFSILGTQVGGL